MLYKRVTKSSVIFMTDEEGAKRAIAETVKSLVGGYEVCIVDLIVTTTAEFYLGQNLPATERNLEVQEVINVFEMKLKLFGKE